MSRTKTIIRKLPVMLLTSAISAALVSGCSSIGANTSMVISNDVRSEVAALRPANVSGEVLALEQAIPLTDLLTVQQDRVLFNGKDGLYATRLVQEQTNAAEDRAPQKLLDVQAMSVSTDGKRALYQNRNGIFVLDLDSGDSKQLLNKQHEIYKQLAQYNNEQEGEFVDATGSYAIFCGQVGTLYVMNSQSGEIITIQLADHFTMENSSYLNSFSIVNNELYLFIEGEHVPAGIYKIALDRQLPAEPAILMEKDNSSPWFQVMSNGNILYAGEQAKKTGVYMYESASGEVYPIIEKKYDELRRGYAFSLSPDETKLLIHDLESEEIIAGELSGHQWLNEKTVLQGYSLIAIIELLADWDVHDSGLVMVRLAYDDRVTSGDVVEKIALIRL